MKRTATLLVALLVAAGPLAAHGGKKHVLGTVTEIDSSHLLVKTREGKSVSLLHDKTTKFRRGDAAARAADLKVGDRVVVDVAGEGEKQKATDIRFSSGGEHGGHERVKQAPKKP